MLVCHRTRFQKLKFRDSTLHRCFAVANSAENSNIINYSNTNVAPQFLTTSLCIHRIGIEAKLTKGHFSVVRLVVWSLNKSEAGVDLVKPNCFSHAILVGILIRKAVQFHKVDSSASLSFKGQATKHTTVKWSIGACRYLQLES